MPALMKLTGYPTITTTRGATCSRCGVPQRRNPRTGAEPVYDLGIEIEMEGTFVICHECALEIGHAAGLITEAEAKVRKSDVNRAEYQARKARKAADAVLAARDALIEAADALRLEEHRSAPEPEPEQ